MTLQLNDNGNPRDLTSGELRDVATGLGLSAGWSNLHGFYTPLDVGVDFCVWPGFATTGPGVARSAAALGQGVAYIGGTRVRFPGADVTTSATMDHYLDVDINGVLTVGIVAVGAVAPAKPPNSIRVARMTTNASTISAVSTGIKDLAGNWVGNYISMPFVRSVKSTAFTPAGGTAAISFGTGTTRYDNASMHAEDTLTERFFAPSPGLYQVTGGVKINSGQAAQAYSLGIRKDGADPVLGDAYGDAATHLGLHVSGLVEMGPLSYITLSLTNAASLVVAQASLQMAKVG